jgi:hypothetical protein
VRLALVVAGGILALCVVLVVAAYAVLSHVARVAAEWHD